MERVNIYLKTNFIMKKIFGLALGLIMATGAMAQEFTPEFTVVKENPITSIKNQNQAGTC